MRLAVVIAAALAAGSFAVAQAQEYDPDLGSVQEETAPARESGETQARPEIHVCPMHPEIAGKEGDRCPKCGMNLEPRRTSQALYVCPMHPEVQRSGPGECPECGMELEAQAPASEEKAS